VRPAGASRADVAEDSSFDRSPFACVGYDARMYFLSDLRSLARSHGLGERKCRDCPPEDWAPTCEVCGGSGRVWVVGNRVVSDDHLVRLGAAGARVVAQPSAA